MAVERILTPDDSERLDFFPGIVCEVYTPNPEPGRQSGWNLEEGLWVQELPDLQI